ncbi:MAG: hypothetical protein IPO07_02895 [Haliscomenobacter sp.]|nr:hypothetical protein [Haliscomenobacter sp.]MBK9487841.1 hypothetical protein [Haliscomenobacter sp.]
MQKIGFIDGACWEKMKVLWFFLRRESVGSLCLGQNKIFFLFVFNCIFALESQTDAENLAPHSGTQYPFILQWDNGV